MKPFRAALALAAASLVIPLPSGRAHGGPVEPWAGDDRPAIRAGLAAARAAAPTFDDLLERRELNPARFDRNHAVLGRLLDRDLVLRSIRDSGILPAEGLLPLSPRLNFFRRRRSLDPGRFDHYHPLLGLLLDEDERLRRPLPGNPSTPGIPSDDGGRINPPPPPPPVVPEPGSLALLGLGLAGALARARGGRRAAERARLTRGRPGNGPANSPAQSQG